MPTVRLSRYLIAFAFVLITQIGLTLMLPAVYSAAAQSSCIQAPSGLAAWWPADGYTSDIIGSNSGTLLNGAAFTAGKVGEAFNFDGVNDHVRIPDATDLRFTSSMTIDAWIFPKALPANFGGIVTKWDAGPGNQRSYSFSITSDSRLILHLSPDGSEVGLNAATVFSNSLLPLNQWSHVAGVYDGQTLAVYINGVLDNQAAYSGGIFAGTDDIAIGANVGRVSYGQGVDFFSGFIDEIDLFNRALSSAEIQAIFNANSVGKCKTFNSVLNFPDFSSISGLSLVGNAAKVGNRLRLTPSEPSQKGAAWFITKQNLQSGFETTFQFQLSGLFSSGADGFAFVIQNDHLSALGDDGGSIGYAGGSNVNGIQNSVAIEFDTWQNISPDPWTDPNDNHISVQSRGTAPNSADQALSLGYTTVIPNISDGSIHTVKVQYAPGSLKVFFDNLNAPVLTAPLNMESILSLASGKAWIGFTAGTGSVFEAHDIISWSFQSTPCTPACPEDIIVTNDLDQCGAVVSYPLLTSGSCGTITCTPPSEAPFPVGTTTVICTGSGGPSCSFTITVEDRQAPSIICPANVTVNENPLGSGSAAVNYPLPALSDNCSGFTRTCTPPSGSSFSLGTTSVICTVTDVSKNTASCSFTITVTGPTLYGTIGIWDGDLWPLNGGAVRSLKVQATRLSDGFAQEATTTKPKYRFDDLPEGQYRVTVEFEYVEPISVDNRFKCLKLKGGCNAPFPLRKVVKRIITGVSVPSILPQDIKLPLPIVMVHGINSCFEKWYKVGDSNEDKAHWDNFARARGFITLTPNYHYAISDTNPWESAALEVQTHIEQLLRGLTTKANSTSYPNWVYIGHSQGGLIARVLINNNSSPLIVKLRKAFLLGTPNSGSVLDLPLIGEPCFGYLTESEMQKNFNQQYPSFGSTDITVYAGTRECNVFFKDCLREPGTHDSLVSVESARNIYLKPCSICPRVLLQSLFGYNVFYNHEELGSPASLEILVSGILPQVITLSGL